MEAPCGASRSHSLDTPQSVELLWTSVQPDTETNTCKQAIQTFIPPVEFEPTITASEWPQTDAFYMRSHWARYVVILAYILLLQFN